MGRLGVAEIVGRRGGSPDSAAVGIAMRSCSVAEIIGRRSGSTGGTAIGVTVDSSTIAKVIGGGSGGADINLSERGEGNGYHCDDEGDDLFHDVCFLLCYTLFLVLLIYVGLLGKVTQVTKLFFVKNNRRVFLRLLFI